MAMSAIDDDLTAVFDTAVFGVDAEWTDRAGAKKTIKGIFDSEDAATDDASFPQYVKVTKFTCKSADVTGISPNDIIRVNTANYRVAYLVDDGVGVVEIHLSTDDIPDAR